MESLICLNCKNEFLVKNYRKDIAKFCSRKCVSEFNTVKIVCLNCKKEFKNGKTTKDRVKFCSKKCRNDYHSKRGKMIICKNCNKELYVPFFKKETSKFCSNKCRKEFLDNSKELICPICNKKFIREKWKINKSNIIYCSKECFLKRSPKVKMECCGCKKEILVYPSRIRYYSKIYCSNECRLKYGCIRRLTTSVNFNKNYQKFVRSIRHSSLYYDWRNRCLERDGYKCCECFSDKSITVHHKNKTMYDFVHEYGFNKQKIIKDKDFYDDNNGESLCRKCHFKFHKKGK